MKKKSLLFAILVAVFAISFISIGDDIVCASAAEIPNEITLSEYYENTNKSILIYDQIIKQYKIMEVTCSAGEKKTTYSDDFGGVFLDDSGFLNIGIVGSNNVTFNYGEQVIYKQFDFSYNYLQSIYDELVPVMVNYEISTIGIKDDYNQVMVYLNEEKDIENVIAYLNKKGLYNKKAINFISGPDNMMVNRSSDIAYGGGAIFGQAAGMYGTVCVNAIDNVTGRMGVLTNEHVALAQQNSEAYYLTDPTTLTYLGEVSRGQDSGTIDAAFIPFDNDFWSPTSKANCDADTFSNIVLGNESHIFVNCPVMAIGKNSKITHGKVTMSNTSTTTNGTQKSNVFAFTNLTIGGDSGGPVYFDDGTNNLLRLIGMIFAGAGNDTYTVACRISNVMTTLNVTPITRDCSH